MSAVWLERATTNKRSANQQLNLSLSRRPKRVRETHPLDISEGVSSKRRQIAQTHSSKMADGKDKEKAPVTEVLEEDDEFEEFAEANWDESAEDQEDLQQWQDDWDDDDMDDDFCNQLRAELAKTRAGATASSAGQAKPQS